MTKEERHAQIIERLNEINSRLDQIVRALQITTAFRDNTPDQQALLQRGRQSDFHPLNRPYEPPVSDQPSQPPAAE